MVGLLREGRINIEGLGCRQCTQNIGARNLCKWLRKPKYSANTVFNFVEHICIILNSVIQHVPSSTITGIYECAAKLSDVRRSLVGLQRPTMTLTSLQSENSAAPSPPCQTLAPNRFLLFIILLTHYVMSTTLVGSNQVHYEEFCC